MWLLCFVIVKFLQLFYFLHVEITNSHEICFPLLVDIFVSSLAGNVLLLKNHLNLSPDIPEVSQEKLLSLVAERLIDSNSNVNVIPSCFLIMHYLQKITFTGRQKKKKQRKKFCLLVFLSFCFFMLIKRKWKKKKTVCEI